MNLDQMNFEELKELQEKVAIAIFEYNKRQKAEALAAAIAAAKAYGFSLEDITGEEKTPKARKAAPKYVHPEDPDITWSGRGRKPKWIEASLLSGKSLKDLEI